jgi:hypothetical protein
MVEAEIVTRMSGMLGSVAWAPVTVSGAMLAKQAGTEGAVER